MLRVPKLTMVVLFVVVIGWMLVSAVDSYFSIDNGFPVWRVDPPAHAREDWRRAGNYEVPKCAQHFPPTCEDK